MPKYSYCSFISCYKYAVRCRRQNFFYVPYSKLNDLILFKLTQDGYLRLYVQENYLYWAIPLVDGPFYKWTTIKMYSTPKRHFYITLSKLLEISWTGGYFLLSTQLGILNDEEAKHHCIGGILLFGFF